MSDVPALRDGGSLMSDPDGQRWVSFTRAARSGDDRPEHDACGVGFVADVAGRRGHSLIKSAVEILGNLLHRGGTGADLKTGDGAGLLFQIPDRFFRSECERLKIPLTGGLYGVGVVFLPHEAEARQRCRAALEEAAAEEGSRVLGWRAVPTCTASLGDLARQTAPVIVQCFLASNGLDEASFERRLYVIRKQAEKKVGRHAPAQAFHIPSLSCRTIVYKGMMTGKQLTAFYPDLKNPDMETALVVLHQRYSTNTFPSWRLAQPFRYLAHNGEINTLRGNRNWMRARERSLRSEWFGEDIKKLLPIIEEDGSDSASLDNVLELLVAAGRSIEHAMFMLIPQAWGAKYPMGPDLRGFFEYHAGLMEPWDGPAAVAFTDGRRVGALLDRNGLRPGRYSVTREGFIVFASEAGVLPELDPAEIVEKGSLRPGQMLLVDTEQQRILPDSEIKMRLARRQPYRRWVEENKIEIHGFFSAVEPLEPDVRTLFQRQLLFGYTREDVQMILGHMASTGSEPVGSMGADQPLAVLSEHPQLLYWYFKQLFAQVTNPAIDPIREELVMSLMTFLGTTADILSEVPQHARLVKLRHPILTDDDLDRIRNLNLEDFKSRTLPIGFPLNGGGADLKNALASLCVQAEGAVKAGFRFVILSDRGLPQTLTPVPALLAVAAVNQHLLRAGLRTSVSLIVETGEAREVMHMALLLGYGASAINPYLAFEIVADLALKKNLSAEISVTKATENYIKALCKGILKIMSKLGISTLRSYRGSQTFEAVGLSHELIRNYFDGTTSRVGGIGLDEIAAEANARRAAATTPPWRGAGLLPLGGQYKYRLDGERHLWNPATISLLQRAARNGDFTLYKQYAALINDQAEKACTLRGLLRFRTGTEPVPLEEVEPASEIIKRFCTAAMSFGSISREAHETLAVAMNRLGAMSNSGEGGEDPERYRPLPNGDNRCSAVKQVASGRFGVTAEYLVNCRELQIKIAQGAKPGEGGQLPGQKVNSEIARVRHSIPGVTLISPPPHHDIYSIEDIKQLIYDLRNANDQARISVKLVAEAGVGTVAAGVAKAGADMILISGYDGGTGASPLSSIKHAGVPWELGLAETQQTLVQNGLRSRVRLQVDGQLKTGRDVVVAALLGAEEFGFAAAPLVVCGCVMERKCHQNTCSVGVATQNPELRKRFCGRPEHVMNFFRMLAEEVREYMAQLGFRTMDEMIGRSDLLEMNPEVKSAKARTLDFSKLLLPPTCPPSERRCTLKQPTGLDEALDWKILSQIEEALDTGRCVSVSLPIRNVNRTVGTLTASRIVRRYGSRGLPDGTITLKFTGAAGQSFGAFCVRGMTLILEGEANDYLGKGLSGARIVVRPYPNAGYAAHENVIAGNVLLYGATSGEVFINGRVGERFAVRNSGAHAVVEGVGDHGCEYMTGGRVVILGPTGVNFAAGMSGGIAYVYDETGMFDANCNLEMVDLELVTNAADLAELRALIEKHYRYTGSARAETILTRWDDHWPRFLKVFPMDYRRALGQMTREDEAIERVEAVRE